MKALKKWWKNSPYKKQDLENKCEYELIKIGWRAALKCLQGQIDFGNKIAYSGNDVLRVVEKFINEELKDEN